jgi:hypothetical protein
MIPEYVIENPSHNWVKKLKIGDSVWFFNKGIYGMSDPPIGIVMSLPVNHLRGIEDNVSFYVEYLNKFRSLWVVDFDGWHNGIRWMCPISYDNSWVISKMIYK